jgi:hypothetical protein
MKEKILNQELINLFEQVKDYLDSIDIKFDTITTQLFDGRSIYFVGIIVLKNGIMNDVPIGKINNDNTIEYFL